MWKYEVGMYGGGFDPLHQGHVNCIVEAYTLCKELHIILSYSIDRDRINYKQRFQWLCEITKDMENVFIHAIGDSALDKDSYDWENGAEEIKKVINKPIDVVFSGEEYLVNDIFKQLYPDSARYVFSRKTINVSSTLIHENPYLYWDYLPDVVKPYYVLKVLVVGVESTGKSTLVRNLALAFNTNYVEEVGRTISERGMTQSMMLDKDFHEIMVRHKALEYEKTLTSYMVLFIDTDVLTTQYYYEMTSTNPKNSYSNISSGMAQLNEYDIVLMLGPDEVPAINDNTRNEEILSNREDYTKVLKSVYSKYYNFIELNGDYRENFTLAKNIVIDLLNKKSYQ